MMVYTLFGSSQAKEIANFYFKIKVDLFLFYSKFIVCGLLQLWSSQRVKAVMSDSFIIVFSKLSKDGANVDKHNVLWFFTIKF